MTTTDCPDTDCPQLKQMGVQNPAQIRDYAVNSISGVDVLRIIYKREKGSLLPVSRSYEFPRVQREIKSASGKKKSVMETAPALRTAVDELKALIQARTDRPTLAESILDELESLEHEMAWRIEHIRELLKGK